MSDMQLTVIRGVLIPLQGMTLLLPNVSIAEVVDYSTPVPTTHTSDWLSGMVSWRGQMVPLVIFEQLVGKASPKLTSNSRIAILNTSHKNAQVDFFGLLTQGIPRLVRVAKDELVTDDAAGKIPQVLCSVKVAGESAIIPDLDKIEAMISNTIK